MKLRSRIPKFKIGPLKTSAACDAALETIETGIEDCEKALAKLTDSRSTALLEGRDHDVDAFSSEIRTLQDELETRRSLKPKVEELQSDLAKAEEKAELEATMTEAEEAAANLAKHLSNFDEFQEKAAAELDAAEALDAQIRKANDLALDKTRKVRKACGVKHPVGVLAAHLDTQVPDPIQLFHKIPFYRPARPGGSPYRHLKDLKVKTWRKSSQG